MTKKIGNIKWQVVTLLQCNTGILLHYARSFIVRNLYSKKYFVDIHSYARKSSVHVNVAVAKSSILDGETDPAPS